MVRLPPLARLGSIQAFHRELTVKEQDRNTFVTTEVLSSAYAARNTTGMPVKSRQVLLATRTRPQRKTGSLPHQPKECLFHFWPQRIQHVVILEVSMTATSLM